MPDLAAWHPLAQERQRPHNLNRAYHLSHTSPGAPVPGPVILLMPSYRFCRPDDIPFLARAINECYDVHFPGAPRMTVERYRAEMKALDVWPSNSLVASTDQGPVAVLIATKRADEVTVLRVGARPGHERQGHGAHLLTSLSNKLAVLGPDRLATEAPRSLPVASALLEATGYRRELTYTDYLREPTAIEPVPEDLFMPVTVAELDEYGLLEIPGHVALARQCQTLLNRKDELEGIAIVTPERVEAGLLHRLADDGASLDVVAAVARPSEQADLLLQLLLRHLAGTTELPLRLPRLAPAEVPTAVLDALGFEAGEQYDRFVTEATPA